jgi:hypothetical protein
MEVNVVKIFVSSHEFSSFIPFPFLIHPLSSEVKKCGNISFFFRP